MTNRKDRDIIYHVAAGKTRGTNGSIAQLGEHLPYKQRVIGSSPIVPTKKSKPKGLDFFIHCESNGISSRDSVYITNNGNSAISFSANLIYLFG